MLPILPVPPSINDPVNFDARAEAFLAALPAWTEAANLLEQSLQLSALSGTSTTSMTVGVGSRSLVTQSGKAWSAGAFVYIVSAASAANFMVGQITSYSAITGDLSASVDTVSGAGTYANWILGLSVPRGSSVAYSGTLTASALAVDSAYTLTLLMSNPLLQFDSGDYIWYDRSNNRMGFSVGGVDRMTIDAADGPQRPNDAATPNGLVRKAQLPGAASTTVAGLIKISDAPTTQTGAATDCAVMPADLHATILGGVGQTYQNLTASRSLGTNYTNSTGRMIEVSVWIGGGGSAGAASFVTGRVDGMDMYFATNNDQNGGAYNNPPMGLTMRVKAGSTYQVYATLTGGQSLNKWVELR